MRKPRGRTNFLPIAQKLGILLQTSSILPTYLYIPPKNSTHSLTVLLQQLYDVCVDLITKIVYNVKCRAARHGRIGGNLMKSTGIVRKVDELGRIVLPIELRRTLDIAREGLHGDLHRGGHHYPEEVSAPRASSATTPGTSSPIRGKNVCSDCIRMLEEKI